MKFDLRQLNYFVVLAETKHFGLAAAKLHISQPPLSRQIASLESALGVVLLERSTRHVALTPTGVHFYQEAKRLLNQYQSLIDSTQAVARGEKGTLTIGFTMSAAWSVLPGLIRQLSEAFPLIDVKLIELLPSALNQSLLAGEIDCGVAYPWQKPSGFSYHALFREPLCAVVPATHPLAAAGQIEPHQLRDEVFISFPSRTAPALHTLVWQCCLEGGFEPNVKFETHLQQTIVNLVAEGLGVAIVPHSMSKMQLAGAVFIPLTSKQMVEQGAIWLTSNDNPSLNSAKQCFQTYQPI